MMSEADDMAAEVCKALQDEHEKRAKYFKQGKFQIALVLHLSICQITWSLWRGTQGLTKIGLKFVSRLVKHGVYISRGVCEPMLGYSWASICPLYYPCILLSVLTHAWSI